MNRYDRDDHARYTRLTKLLNGSMAVVACSLGAAIVLDPVLRADPRWVYWLIWPMATLHTVEEYIVPGRFVERFNVMAMGSATPLGPLTARRAFFTDAVAGLVNPLLLLVLGLLHLPAVWVFYGLLSVNAAFHISEAVKSGRYFPGVITSVFLYFPGFTAITYFYMSNGLLTLGDVVLFFGLGLLATMAFFRQVRAWARKDAIGGIAPDAPSG